MVRLPYSGEDLERENFRILVRNENFTEKTFADCSGPIIMWVWPQNVAEKTFTDGSETTKSAKFSPSKVFHYTIL